MMLELANNKHTGILIAQDENDLVLTVTPESVGAATAAQGELADTALQAGSLLTDMSSGNAPIGYVPKADGAGAINWVAETIGGEGGSSPATWGSISGTLSSQLDLQEELDAKLGVIPSEGGTWAVTCTSGEQDALGIPIAVSAFTNSIPSRDGAGRVNVGEPTDGTHATTKTYVDGHVGTREPAVRKINGGSGFGTYTLDVASVVNTEVTRTLTGNSTLAFSNVPSGRSTQVLFVTQDATGGRTLSYPANTTFLNGSDGSINPAANSTTVLVFIHLNGPGSRIVSVSDARGPSFDSIDINPQEDGSVYKTFAYPTTLDVSSGGVVKRGTGTVVFAKSTGGGFSTVSGASESFAAGDVLRVTTSGFSGWLTLSIPRVA